MNDGERGPLLGYGQHGLALEINPWQTKRSVEAALLYRGAIVAAWANVEATLIEVALRASKQPEYEGLRDNYPSKLKGRVAFLRQVVTQPGPLLRYSSAAISILNRYVSTQDLRNLMAHGGMRILPDWGATFQMFRTYNANEITMLQRRFPEEELCRLAHKTARFSRAVQGLKARLDQLELLPPLSSLE